MEVKGFAKSRGRIPPDEILRRARAVFDTGLPSASALVNRYRGQSLFVCGGGPSLADVLPEIRRRRKLSKRTKILAINRTHDWLISKGIKPDFALLMDPKPWCAEYMTPTKGVTYLIGAKVDPAVWERFKGYPHVYHFHPGELPEEREILPREFGSHPSGYLLVPGQSTAGLRSVPLFYELGFRAFYLCGLDSSRREGKPHECSGNGHAYEKYTPEQIWKYQPENDLGDAVLHLRAADGTVRMYDCSEQMSAQVDQFVTMVEEFKILEQDPNREPIEIKVFGTGALPYLAAKKYGLHINPAYNANAELMPGYVERRGLKVGADPTGDTPISLDSFASLFCNHTHTHINEGGWETCDECNTPLKWVGHIAKPAMEQVSGAPV